MELNKIWIIILCAFTATLLIIGVSNCAIRKRTY